MTAPFITIFVRHTPGCKYGGDEFTKRCNCRKHLRWTLAGSQQRRATGTRSWAEAEQVKREIEDQLTGREVTKVGAPKTVEDAVKVFTQAKTVEGITADGLARYARELKRLQVYAERHGVFTVAGLSRELLTGYAATWTTSSGTRALTAKTLKCFLRYCFESQWLVRIPTLPRITVDAAATEPLTTDEYTRLLAAASAPKLHALIQLMRYSGLAVRDAVTLERAEIEDCSGAGFYRVTTNRQKTGTHVSVPIPIAVAEEILSVNANPRYIFWHGLGDGQNFAIGYGAAISEAFDRAGIAEVCFMKSHRLRDTFAVTLLEKGVPLEEVSKLLGHESIRTTEKHYARWVQARQDRLDALVMATWG
jgi:integrase/recombinase XerD